MGAVPRLTRITRDHGTMGGKPCIRGTRVTVGTIVACLRKGTVERPFSKRIPISNRKISAKR